MDNASLFLARLSESLAAASFVKLVLGKYRGHEAGLKTVLVVARRVQQAEALSFISRFETRETTANLAVDEGLRKVKALLGADFRSAHLFTTRRTVQVEFGKKGKSRLTESEPVCGTVPPREHDRVKARLLDPARPFLRELGVTSERHQVLPSMSRKWKQINVFLDRFRHAWESSRVSQATPVRVMDFGSGKGYLTFAIYDYLSHTLGMPAEVTGVELRPDLVQFCQAVAGKLGLSGLSFRQGAIRDYPASPLDVLIALHACDTATDLAIAAGVRGDAGIIMTAPCCHKELRPQMVSPAVLSPVLRHGIHLGQEAEMVTDALRALWLEASGYDAQVIEFVSLEHTAKNKMILAVRRASPPDPAPVLAQIRTLKAFYGIQHHALEQLLGSGVQLS